MLKPGTTDYKRAKNAELYDRLNLVVPKGRKAAVEAFAKSRGESINGLVNALLRAEMGISEEDWKKQEE
jgi:hypothetical protein